MVEDLTPSLFLIDLDFVISSFLIWTYLAEDCIYSEGVSVVSTMPSLLCLPMSSCPPMKVLEMCLVKMTVTWTSGCDIEEAIAFVEWGMEEQSQRRSTACVAHLHGQLVGMILDSYIQVFLNDLWPNIMYTYKMGNLLSDGSCIWSKTYSFKSSPFPGQDSLQKIIIFGEIGKAERDGSNEYSNYQPGSLNTTDQLIKDLKNIDIVFHIGDLSYANEYITQWDQFTSQVEPIALTVPYMVARFVPAENRAKFWYSADYGMFHFCCSA